MTVKELLDYFKDKDPDAEVARNGENCNYEITEIVEDHGDFILC